MKLQKSANSVLFRNNLTRGHAQMISPLGYTANHCNESTVEVRLNDCTPLWIAVIYSMRFFTALN